MENYKDSMRIVLWSVAGMLLMVVAFVLSGCRTKYIPIETRITDSVVVHDSIVEIQLVPYKDSVSVAADSSFLSNPYAYSYANWDGERLNHSLGVWENTMLSFKIMWLTRYRTIEVPKPYPVEVIKEVEKELNLWQRLRLWLGNVFVLGIIVVATWRVIKSRLK